LDRSLVAAAARVGLQVVINAKPANHGRFLDVKLGEAGCGCSNARGGGNDKAFVRGKSEAAVGFKFMLDVIRQTGSICGTCGLILGRGSGGKVTNMKGQQCLRMTGLECSQGRGQKEP
jgi:hypothetical protein